LQKRIRGTLFWFVVLQMDQFWLRCWDWEWVNAARLGGSNWSMLSIGNCLVRDLDTLRCSVCYGQCMSNSICAAV